MSEIISQRTCKVCGENKPLTKEYFQSVKKGRNFRVICKICTSIERRTAYALEHPNEEEPISEGLKRCSTCKEIFEATTKYFHRNKAQNCGFSNACKVCENKRGKEYDQRSEVKEKRLPRMQAWNDAHKEEHSEYYRNYNQVNRERLRPSGTARGRLRLARERGATGKHTAQDIQDQFKRQHGKCYYCNIKIKKAGKNEKVNYQVDHIVPISRENSSNAPWNLVITCVACNQSKGNKLPHEWPQGGRLL